MCWASPAAIHALSVRQSYWQSRTVSLVTALVAEVSIFIPPAVKDMLAETHPVSLQLSRLAVKSYKHVSLMLQLAERRRSIVGKQWIYNSDQ